MPQNKEVNAARQTRYRERHANDPAYRMQRIAYARKQRLKAKRRRKGSVPVAELVSINKELHTPRTNRKHERELSASQAELSVLLHYTNLLSSHTPEPRLAGICWFRAVKGESDPYYKLLITPPFGFHPRELETPTPPHWRFHASDLTKNYHGEHNS